MSRVFVFTQYGGPEHQRLLDRDVPVPGAGEVLVRVSAAGVNPFDCKLRSGRYGENLNLPAGLGSEMSGVVAAVGDGVVGFAVGDAVLASVAPGAGGVAEHVLIAASGAVIKPEGLSFVAAATIPVAGTTAYDITHTIELEPGQTVLVVGAGGGVGLIAAQLGRVLGAAVIGVASASKRELVESTGATFVLSGTGFADRVRELAPDGVDLVLDLVGGATLRAAAPLAKSPDRVVSIADESVVELGGATRTHHPDALEKVTAVFGDGLVDPHITTTYPLNRAAEAFARVEEGHAPGKTVVEVD